MEATQVRPSRLALKAETLRLLLDETSLVHVMGAMLDDEEKKTTNCIQNH